MANARAVFAHFTSPSRSRLLVRATPSRSSAAPCPTRIPSRPDLGRDRARRPLRRRRGAPRRLGSVERPRAPLFRGGLDVDASDARRGGPAGHEGPHGPRSGSHCTGRSPTTPRWRSARATTATACWRTGVCIGASMETKPRPGKCRVTSSWVSLRLTCPHPGSRAHPRLPALPNSPFLRGA